MEQAKTRLREKFKLSGQVVPASQYYHEIQNTFGDPGQGHRSNLYTNILAAQSLRHNANENERCRGGICPRITKKIKNFFVRKPAQGGRKTHRRKSRSRRTRRTRR